VTLTVFGPILGLLAFFLTLVASTVAASAADSAPAAPGEAALLAEYLPVTYLYRRDWKPVAVETLLASAALEKRTRRGWRVVRLHPSAVSLPVLRPSYRLDIGGCTPARDLDSCYHDAAASAPTVGTVYGRDWLNPSSSGRIHQVLQYWFFSYLNDWRNSLVKPTVWQMHEGDWEVACVAMGADGRPLEVAYSQHDRGVVRQWASVPLAGGTHPIDYVALGSHANYFTIGLHGKAGSPHRIPTSFSGAPLIEPDFTSSQTSYGPPGLATHPARIVDVSAGAAWLNFAGAWGDGNYLLFGNRPGSFVHLRLGDSPPGPAFQDTWRRPARVFQDWPPDDSH
jgi:hypothetical protein